MTRLTIGMPIYNNAATIRASLDSLLAQTLTDFVLVISDNGSTDDTPAICQEYAARDPRVRYIRQPVNLGPAMNFRFVLFEARTPYFMWAAGDDLWMPTFAERNVAMLDMDPTLVMSQSHVMFTVDGKPTHLATGTYALLGTPEENIARYFYNPADNSRYYAVWRTAALQQVFPPRSFYALDWAVSAATLRLGRHYEIPEVLMIRDSSDPASYANAVAKDHRFFLWRVFPLLFMTIWLLRQRLIPVNREILHHLAKANLYIHFRFGSWRIESVAQRYFLTNSLRQSIGLHALLPERRLARRYARHDKAHRMVLGMERIARGVFRRLPVPLAAREALKARGFRLLGRSSGYLAAYRGWQDPAAPPAAEPAQPAPPVADNRIHELRQPVGEPALSVIVLAETGFPETRAAAAAAAGLCEAIDAEVIIVANGGLHLNLSLMVTGAHIVEMPHGSSFGAMMNAGLAQAGAARILTLRADSWYEAGLGAAVLEALDSAPLVAPQLLHANGVLGAAGGIYTRKDAAYRDGRFGVAEALDYSFARACDYAPHAFAWRREVEPSDAPFDEEMANFDLVVADFCMRVRAFAGPPLYWPFARVTCPVPPHFPGAEPIPAGWFADLAKLEKRHAAQLDQDEMLAAEGRTARDRWRGKRLLYVDADTPTPDQNAGSIEAINLMRIFDSLGFRVTFVPESNFIHRGNYTDDLQKMGVRTVHYPFCTSVEQLLTETPEPFDVIVLCRVWIAARHAPLIRRLAPDTKILFNTVDLHFLREQREAELSGDATAIATAETSKRQEMAVIESCDVTVVLSAFEREMLAREAPGAKVHVLPLVRAIPPRLEAPGPEGRRDVMFIGTYQHPPNEDAVLFFAREVWPLLRPRLPGAKFLVVGSAVTPAVAALACDDIEVTGFVHDLDPLLNAARVSVAPLRYGAGLKGKVGTTLQAGLATVATDIAAEGMGLTDGREVLIANDPASLADAIVRVYQDDDLWRSLVAEGFAFVRREFSLEANVPRIAAILDDLGVSTLQSERLLMHYDLQAGDPVFRPSQFWLELSADHEQALAEWRLMSFKRTINNCYMQWLPGSFDDPRLKLPMDAFHERPSMVPMDIAESVPPQPELAYEVRGFGDFRPFGNPDYARFYGFYVGLLWYQMSLHASDDLYRRIQEPRLGHPIALSLKDQAISQDLAQSLLEYYRIKQMCADAGLPERRTYLELGAGYGRLAYVILSAAPCRYIIVDIPPTLLVSKWYLSRVFPEMKVFGYRAFDRYEDVQEEIEAADIVFLTPNQYAKLPDDSVDVSISISNLHEMTRDQMTTYKALLQRTTRRMIYIKQWQHWRNPSDGIEVGRADYTLVPPWGLVLDSTDLSNVEFLEQGWTRFDRMPSTPPPAQ